MTNRLISSAFAASIFAIMLPDFGKAQTVVLYSNAATNGGEVADAGTPTYSVDGQNYQSSMVIDSFTLNQAATISMVEVWGPSPGNFPPVFTFNFYANNNGSPGALLKSENILTEPGISSQEVAPGAFEELATETGILSAPLTLQAGSYFFGAWDDEVGAEAWAWDTSAAGQGSALLLDSASSSYDVLPVDVGSNVEFELEGSAVPEPSAYFLSLLSIAMFVAAKMTGVERFFRRS